MGEILFMFIKTEHGLKNTEEHGPILGPIQQVL